MDETPNIPESALPPAYMETARIEIVKGLSPTGTEDVGFMIRGMNRAEAIGQLTGVLERVKLGMLEQWTKPRNDAEDEGGGY